MISPLPSSLGQQVDQAKPQKEERGIEQVYYILGVHAVRVSFDDAGIIEDAERYDLQSGTFVRDYKTALRVADHVEADKVDRAAFEKHCAQMKS